MENEKTPYEAPAMTVVRFDGADVIRTSNIYGDTDYSVDSGSGFFE